jgi:hypothetical protein
MLVDGADLRAVLEERIELQGSSATEADACGHRVWPFERTAAAAE